MQSTIKRDERGEKKRNNPNLTRQVILSKSHLTKSCLLRYNAIPSLSKYITTFSVVNNVQIVQKLSTIFLSNFTTPKPLKENKNYPATITCVQLFDSPIYWFIYFFSRWGRLFKRFKSNTPQPYYTGYPALESHLEKSAKKFKREYINPHNLKQFTIENFFFFFFLAITPTKLGAICPMENRFHIK